MPCWHTFPYTPNLGAQFAYVKKKKTHLVFRVCPANMHSRGRNRSSVTLALLIFSVDALPSAASSLRALMLCTFSLYYV